jgi:hypothetical protein
MYSEITTLYTPEDKLLLVPKCNHATRKGIIIEHKRIGGDP